MLRRRLVLLLSALVLVVVPSTALADGSVGSGGGGFVDIGVSDPGSGGASSTGSGGGSSSGGSAVECPMQPMNPQPPAGSSLWSGRNPNEGSIYLMYRKAGTAGRTSGFSSPDGCEVAVPLNSVFVPNGVAAAPPPDPKVLAQDAFGQLRLPTAVVHTAPQTPAKTYVGIDTWLWTASATWQTMTKSVTAGSTTVTVTAKPDRITWSTGDGYVNCPGPGTPWPFGSTDASLTTDCSYTYKSVGTKALSATAVFVVTWTCSGVCLQGTGSLGEVTGPAGNGSIVVDERQSVNIR